jgi:CDP-paratose 2-epimerase
MSLAPKPHDVEAGSGAGHPDQGPGDTMNECTLVLGGAGFIGSHLTRRLLESGQPVVVLDSLARPGTDAILRRLRAEYGDLLEIVIGDLRDRTALRRAVSRAARVVHLAAQVGAGESLRDPHLDFEINLRGTVDLLEELRRADRPIPLLYGSTTKVYGALRKLQLVELRTRYAPESGWIAEHGIDEHWPLEIESPYGCSRVAADQYVLEYARSFRLPAVVARIGCVYGPDQPGCEDQGWIGRLMASALDGRPVVVEGDGKQVRDPLHVDDLVEALVQLTHDMEELRGHAFNVGGGPDQAVSVRELVEVMSQVIGESISITHADWREGDARYFVSNPSKLEAMTGWRPTIALGGGLRQLHAWLLAARRMAAAPALVGADAVSG